MHSALATTPKGRRQQLASARWRRWLLPLLLVLLAACKLGTSAADGVMAPPSLEQQRQLPAAGYTVATSRSHDDVPSKALTATREAAANSIASGQCIETTVNASACVASSNGRFSCCLRRDGVIALYDGPGRARAYWAAAPAVNQSLVRPVRLCMLGNGTLAGLDANGTLFWSSSTTNADTAGLQSYTAYMQNDGVLAVYNTSCFKVWQAGKVRNPLKNRKAPCAARPDVRIAPRGGTLQAPGYERICAAGAYLTAMTGWCRVTQVYDAIKGTEVHNMTGLGPLTCSNGASMSLTGTSAPGLWRYGVETSGFSGMVFDATAIINRNGPCLARGERYCQVYCGDQGQLDIKQECPDGMVVAGLFGNATASAIVSIGLVCRQLTL